MLFQKGISNHYRDIPFFLSLKCDTISKKELDKVSPKITKTKAKKYRSELKKMKMKVVTVARLSAQVGIIESVLREELAFFDPMVRMDESYNVLRLIPELERYIEPSSVKVPRAKPRKKSSQTYESLGDYVYRNFTVPGGIVDQHVILSNQQLHDLRKLVLAEIKQRKSQKE